MDKRLDATGVDLIFADNRASRPKALKSSVAAFFFLKVQGRAQGSAASVETRVVGGEASGAESHRLPPVRIRLGAARGEAACFWESWDPLTLFGLRALFALIRLPNQWLLVPSGFGILAFGRLHSASLCPVT